MKCSFRFKWRPNGAGQWEFFKLLLAEPLLGGNLAYGGAVLMLSTVQTLPVPPPCSRLLNRDKWASWAGKARAILRPKRTRTNESVTQGCAVKGQRIWRGRSPAWISPGVPPVSEKSLPSMKTRACESVSVTLKWLPQENTKNYKWAVWSAAGIQWATLWVITCILHSNLPILDLKLTSEDRHSYVDGQKGRKNPLDYVNALLISMFLVLLSGKMQMMI